MPWKNEPELNSSRDTVESVSENSSQSLHVDKDQPLNTRVDLSSASLDSILKELISELKRKRRWGFALKLITILLVIGLLAGLFSGQSKQLATDHTAIVYLDGVIADGYDASAENVLSGLRSAFQSKRAKGIILNINSPGGSPVQADMLYQEIQRLKSRHPKPFIAVISDIGASGGYYAAVAADSIYANRSSIVGSIGVLMDGYGFVGLMDKVGIERRLITAGKHKGSLDPFSPLDDEDLSHAKSVINGVHQQFISIVRKSRGARLKETEETFSGLFWNGEQAYNMGLTDGFKSPWAVAREDIGQEIIIDYTLSPDFVERFSKQLGVSIAQRLKTMILQTIPQFQ